MYKKSFLLNEGGMANYEKQVEQEAAYPIFGLSLIIFPHLITILKSWPNHRNQKQPTCSQVNIPIMRLTILFLPFCKTLLCARPMHHLKYNQHLCRYNLGRACSLQFQDPSTNSLAKTTTALLLTLAFNLHLQQ